MRPFYFSKFAGNLPVKRRWVTHNRFDLQRIVCNIEFQVNTINLIYTNMLKNLLGFLSITLVAVMVICSTGITSCTKTTTKIDTVTVTKIDTVTKTDTLKEKDTALTAAILTANPWKAQYDRASVGGSIAFYQRGGSGNTMNLDNEYITFNSNNTGIYTNNSGTQTTFTWNFTNATNTTLVWTWNLSPSVTVTWENISYDDNALHYTEYYVNGGVNSLSTEVRIPQ
jgi:hypothetical protein